MTGLPLTQPAEVFSLVEVLKIDTAADVSFGQEVLNGIQRNLQGWRLCESTLKEKLSTYTVGTHSQAFDQYLAEAFHTPEVARHLPPLHTPESFPKGSLSDYDYNYRCWERFHNLNPQVYTMLLSASRLFKRRGRKRFGIRMFWEQLRWLYAFTPRGGEERKLNNNYTRWYARKIILDFPEFEGFFEIRERKNRVEQ